MMASSYANANGGKSEWFATSGLPDYLPNSAASYAQRLVRYISDASTVRARVMEQYGRAPAVDQIRGWRADWLALVASRADGRNGDDYDEEYGLDASNDDDFPGWAPAPILPARTAKDIDHVPEPVIAAVEPQPAQRPAAIPKPNFGRAITKREIMEQCAATCGVPLEDILGHSRNRRLVHARQFTAAILRARGNSYPQIGAILDRDHSTIIHAVRSFFYVVAREPAFAAAWMKLAPCMTKVARTPAELDKLLRVRL